MYTIEADGVMVMDDYSTLPYPANKFMDENLNRVAELFYEPTSYTDPSPKIKILRNNKTGRVEGVVIDDNGPLPEEYVVVYPWD